MAAWHGVHVGDAHSSWILRCRPVKKLRANAPKEKLPDLAVDPRSHVLTLLNQTRTKRAFFISIRSHICMDAAGVKLRPAQWRDRDGKVRTSTTFVVTVHPRKALDVCRISELRRLSDLDIYSDIVDVQAMSEPEEDETPAVLSFPFESGESFLCSQSAGGELTHFAHPSTWHAVDFDAPVGTPLLAVEDGHVHALQEEEIGGGADCSLLFHWNSLTLLLADGHTTVEYVHIRPGSSRVSVGDKVVKGQVICESADAGFCPTPHLHIEVHPHADSASVKSLPIVFQSSSGALFLPQAGSWYNAEVGLVPFVSEAQAATTQPEVPGTAAPNERSENARGVAHEEQDALGAAESLPSGADSVHEHTQDSEAVDSSSSGGWETVSDETSDV